MPSLLEVRSVSKSFSGVEVLHRVDFDLAAGVVHALVGENGAGKSTLIKILSGVYRRDGGSIRIDGQPVEAISPHSAHGLGIVTIYQERNLIPQLSVGENILLGDAPEGPLGIVKWRQLFERAQQILDSLRLDLNAHRRVAELSPAEQQAVEIAKALYKKARIVIMDEPTASLAGSEIDNLFRLICKLREEQVSVIYISHRLDEIFEIADEVTVLRDGCKVLHSRIGEITKEALVRAMVGEELTMTLIAGEPGPEVLLEAVGIAQDGAFRDVSLTLRRGSIVSLAGMIGSGRTNVLRALGGIEPITAGRIRCKGEEIQGKGLAGFIARGICFVPGERDQSGLILPMSVAGNTTIANLGGITRGPLMLLRHERDVAERFVRALDIQAKSVSQEVQYLSGGNRQKVMLSKWLYRGLDVFLLDEPTQGVDVGAREQIHQIMKRLLDEGKAILMVTSDLDELMNMSQWIAVMNKGRIVASLDARKTTREEVLSYAIGNASPDAGGN
jgi:ABC-type sugar transport system ATPase subunit